MTQSLGLWDFLVINFDANPKIRGMKKVLQWKKEFSKNYKGGRFGLASAAAQWSLVMQSKAIQIVNRQQTIISTRSKIRSKAKDRCGEFQQFIHIFIYNSSDFRPHSPKLYIYFARSPSRFLYLLLLVLIAELTGRRSI